MKENEKIIHRLLKYLNFKHIAPTNFEKKAGLSNGYLRTQQRRNADIGESVLIKIIDNCLDVNPLWLMTGKGEMIINDPKPEELSLWLVVGKGDVIIRKIECAPFINEKNVHNTSDLENFLQLHKNKDLTISDLYQLLKAKMEKNE
jgi:hypothetical protein